MKPSLSLILALSLLLSPSASADLMCITALIGKIRAVGKTKVSDLNELGKAMSEGMLLGPHQNDVFEIYRSLFFGEPTLLNSSEPLSRVFETTNLYPEINKPHFREYEIEVDQKIYQSPESLNQHLRSQVVNAGRVRSNLFQIDANIGYWKKLLRHSSLESQNKVEANKSFYRYLNHIISEKNRNFLKSEHTDYRLKVKTLFYTLRRVSEHMDRRGQDSSGVRQAMVDLVAATGFSNKTTQELLKSDNALDRMEGLRRIADERESMTLEIGYKGHFQELLKDLRISSPSLMGKGTDEAKVYSDLEQDISQAPARFLPSKRFRVRSLSLQESPFRSCIGGSDCSTFVYFKKALDPNFFYFTLTDEQNHSSGQITLVLGTAQSDDGQIRRVAFIDKIQNLPNSLISPLLEAIRRSVSEKGYALMIPEDVGDHNGLSNIFITRDFVAKGILPLLTERVRQFTPFPHDYKFEAPYSRSELKLDGRLFEQKHAAQTFRIQAGKGYKPSMADPRLSRSTLRESLFKMRDSKDESDIRRYIKSGKLVERTNHIPLIPMEKYVEDLIEIGNNRSLSFETRKMAFLELLTTDILSRRGSRLRMRHIALDEDEKRNVFEEVQRWSHSNNEREQAVADALSRMWFDGARVNKDVVTVFLDMKLIDPNIKNKTGQTAVTTAVINNNVEALQILLNHPDVEISLTDERGFTALDYARGLGQDETVSLIRNKKSGATHLTETHSAPQGIYQQIEFAAVPRGAFTRANGLRVTINQPFEIQTTLFTQHMYVMAMESAAGLDRHSEDGARMKIKGKVELIFPNHPVNNLRPEQIDEILKRINTWAEQNDSRIYQLVPSHKTGARYDMISADQLEYVFNLAKTESGDSLFELIHSRDWNNVYSHAWLAQAHGPKAVATKKPVWLGTQPIYDLAGNLRVLTKEGSSLGVSWLSGPHSFPNNDSAPGTLDVGLRLIRISSSDF